MSKDSNLGVHPELLDCLIKHSPENFQEMTGLLTMLTGVYAATIANAAAEREGADPTIAQRRDLITSQMQHAMDRLESENRAPQLDWAADLCKYINVEVEGLLVRASKRQLNVFEGRHKPFSPTRGKGFNK